MADNPYTQYGPEIAARIERARAWDDAWDGYRDLPVVRTDGVAFHQFPEDALRPISQNGIQAAVARGGAPGGDANHAWFAGGVPLYAGQPGFAFATDDLRAAGAIDGRATGGMNVDVIQLPHAVAPGGMPVDNAALVYHSSRGYVLPIHVPEDFPHQFNMPPGYEPESPLPGGRDPRDPPRPRTDADPARRTDDGVGPRPVDAPQDPRAQDPGRPPTTTAGDPGGGGGGGGCTTCGATPSAGGGGGSGDAPAAAAGDGPPADAPPPPPPRPADADQAFQRAQRAPGSSADGSVYGVGGTADNPQFYRFSPDGTYQGTVDRIPTEAQMGVSDQMIRMEHPDAPMRRMVTGPDGQRYGVGPEGVAVAEGNGFRTLTPEERASLPRNVQSQLMVRAAGPTLATPDGQNAMYAARARTAGSVIDWAQNQNDAQAAGLAIGSDNVGRRMDSRRR